LDWFTEKTGWWHTYPSEKYDFVSWDDDIPNIWKVIKSMFQTTNQIRNTPHVQLEMPLGFLVRFALNHP
jgi:hypothetical protein